MSITYFIQSKKNLANLYIRIREGKIIDAKAKTNFIIDKSDFAKGKIKTLKTPSNANALQKNIIQEKNNALINLQSELDELRNHLTHRLNTRKEYEIINSNWLKSVVNPNKEKNNIPDKLVGYFDYYLDFKKSSIKKGTYKNYQTIRNRVLKYQEEKGIVYLQEVNKKFGLSLQKWCDDNGLDYNTKIKTIKVVYTICNHSEENGKVLHPECKFITKGLKYKKTHFVTLNFDEIQRLIDLNVEDEKLDIARDWLIISFYTAQRISDFFLFKKNRVVYNSEAKIYFLDITQEKTEIPIYVPLADEVMKIMKKWNNDFPPRFTNNKDSNDAIYNKYIKIVCKKVGMNELVRVKQRNVNTKKYELMEVPKYKAITSHIGRRSFSTNYDNLINNSLLRSATGHSSERQFKQYVNKNSLQDAILLHKEMQRVKNDMKKNKRINLKVI